MSLVPESQISVFDLDKTLLKVNSSFQFGLYLYRKGFFPWHAMLHHFGCYALHHVGLLSMAQTHKRIFSRLFLGKSHATMLSQARAFINDSFVEMIYMPAAQKLLEAKQQGQQTIILSSSPSFLVELLAERFGVSAWAATHYAVDSADCFTGITEWMLGEDKARYVKDLIQKLGITHKHVTAYSDSIHDLPLLKSVGNPVGVNPDRALRAVCCRNDWAIL
jgi:HAD superfamily hydrolase (TIGR01490 family)